MNRFLILNFHGIGVCSRRLERGEDSVWIGVDLFQNILDAVAECGDIEITFDDGNESDVSVALPLLLERGLRARFFVLAGKIGVPGFLTENDLRVLRAEGMGIGLHGRNHVSWRGLTNSYLNDEIEHAKNRIEEIAGVRIKEAACPFGQYDRKVLTRLKSAGFEAVYTSDGGLSRAGSWLRPRYSVRQSDRVGVIEIIKNEAAHRRVVRECKMIWKRLR